MKKILLLTICVALFACTDEPAPIRVESLTLNDDTITLTVGDYQSLEAVVLPLKAENQTVHWSSSNVKVATVADGLVMAVSVGTATITAISDDGGKKATCQVTVNPRPVLVTGVSLTEDNVRVFLGNKLTLRAIITPSDASNQGLLWTTSRSDVATVTDGVVSAVGLGKTKITVETKDGGFKAECSIKVTEECQTQTKGPVTLDLTTVMATTAAFSGTLDVNQLSDYDMNGEGIGFIYAPVGKPLVIESAKKVKLSSVDSENAFSHTLTDLKYDTEYQYTIFLYKNNICQYGEVQKFRTADVSIEVEEVAVTPVTATFNGKLNRDVSASAITFGIQYSTSETFSSSATKSISITENSFSKTVSGLEKGTTYYYRTYVCQNGTYEYSTQKSFKTADVSVVITDVKPSQTSVTIKGKVDPASACEEVTVGILLNTSTTVTSSSYVKRLVLSSSDIAQDGTFTKTITGLTVNQTYNYRYYVLNNGAYSYGEISSFKTSNVTTTLSVSNITPTNAVLKGKISPAAIKSEVTIGVFVNTSSTVDKDNYSKKYTLYSSDIASDGSFTVQMTGLNVNTTHYIRSYVVSNNVYVYGETQNFKTADVTVTLTTDNITSTSVTINGKCTPSSIKNEVEIGILVNTSSSISSSYYSKKYTLTSSEISSSGSFTISLNDLMPERKYYFCSYIRMNGVYGYGEIKSFTTAGLVAPMLNTATDITGVSATISGTVSLAAGTASDLEYGFQYSTSSGFSSGVISKKITDIDSENKFSISIASLVPETAHYYRSYIRMNGVYGYGEIKSFTTLLHPYKVQSDLNMSAATDLSSSATANSYIVSKGGLYKIKAVKGNSTTSVGSVVSASILWETFGTSTTPNLCELIKGVCYKDGYIVFQTADTFKEGNAVIAAKDAAGNILWSWHIWFTDQPQEQVYYNNAGTMMDHNLGATSATPGDVGALGLLYQWGRKDPFLGSSSISSSALAKSTIAWPSAVESSSSNGTIEYATSHPTTYITSFNSSNWDWYYTGSSSTDNTRWTTSDKPKSIYDPCPAGWRVPDGGSNGVWSKALSSSSTFEHTSSTFEHTYSSTNEGMNFSGKFGSASTIWYPASGCRSLFDGGLNSVGNGGHYWSASPFSYLAYSLYVDDNGDVGPSWNSTRPYGQSVRCLQE